VSLQRVFRKLGVSVRLYADHIDPAFKHDARPTSAYRPTGQDIVYFHYSIWSENFAALDKSTDFKIMDYHGVAPPHLSMDFDPKMAALCQAAIDALPKYSSVFDWCVYHAENGRWDLEEAGYKNFSKVRLPVDTSFFGIEEDQALSEMLKQLEYVLFVGRIVPQKDALAIVRVFGELHKYRPDACLFMVGGHDVLPGYVQQVRDEIKRHGIGERVRMTDKISNRAMLTSLYRHAKFLVSLSEWENCCVPTGEAMFFRLPVINAGAVPLPENVGDAGVLIDKTDPVSAARMINEVWENPSTYAELQENAVKRSGWFTDEALLENVAKLMRDLSAAFRGKPAHPAIATLDALALAA
jgi:glycosyltransferase involved in cell wall biosynthesis